MKSPALSFVIPAHNCEAWLAEAVTSCLTQTQKNIEVVIVDDHSTDATLKLAMWFAGKDERVRFTSLIEAFRGRGHARNAGCVIAKAPILAMLDADDTAETKRAARTLAAFSSAGAAYGFDGYFHGGAAVLDLLLQQVAQYIPEAFSLDKTLNSPRLETGIIHSSAAFSKRTWEKYPFDEGEYQAIGLDDWHQQMRMARAGVPFLHSSDLLCGYRPLDGGTVAKRDQNKVMELKGKLLAELNLLPAGVR